MDARQVHGGTGRDPHRPRRSRAAYGGIHNVAESGWERDTPPGKAPTRAILPLAPTGRQEGVMADANKLSWNEIKRTYPNEWVGLVDSDVCLGIAWRSVADTPRNASIEM